MAPETFRHRLQARDLLWAFASPIYMLVGTCRHEGSHALAGLLAGARIAEFVFWPTARGWGYVRFATYPPWQALAAPYVVDVVCFSLGVWLCRRIPRRLHWLWVNAAVVLVASPAIDSIYNYFMAFTRGGDVAGILMKVGPVVTHSWFLTTTVCYLLGSFRVVRPPASVPQVTTVGVQAP